ncbi:hypothetical protein BDF14DRAFT_92155 [Spinellus fusiger]|nr:hypothetical protein BDF14DRAFT_92155 [Spinellus fusiger]
MSPSQQTLKLHVNIVFIFCLLASSLPLSPLSAFFLWLSLFPFLLDFWHVSIDLVFHSNSNSTSTSTSTAALTAIATRVAGAHTYKYTYKYIHIHTHTNTHTHTHIHTHPHTTHIHTHLYTHPHTYTSSRHTYHNHSTTHTSKGKKKERKKNTDACSFYIFIFFFLLPLHSCAFIRTMPSGKIQAPTLCFGDITREEINTLLSETPFTTGMRRKQRSVRDKSVASHATVNGTATTATTTTTTTTTAAATAATTTTATTTTTTTAATVATASAGHTSTTPSANEPAIPEPKEEPAPKPKPTSWAALLKPTTPPHHPTTKQSTAKTKKTPVVGVHTPKLTGIAEIISAYQPIYEGPLLQPRGLINNVNTCFMNVVG